MTNLLFFYFNFSGSKTLNLKNEDVFVKENHMLSRERITFFSQISTDESIKLNQEFVFKGVGTRTKFDLQEDTRKDVKIQFAEKGSYREKQMLETIEHLPNRSSVFTQNTGN